MVRCSSRVSPAPLLAESVPVTSSMPISRSARLLILYTWEHWSGRMSGWVGVGGLERGLEWVGGWVGVGDICNTYYTLLYSVGTHKHPLQSHPPPPHHTHTHTSTYTPPHTHTLPGNSLASSYAWHRLSPALPQRIAQSQLPLGQP